MGPVIGLAYGSTIRDWRMVWRSLKVELISVLVCIVVGVCIGLITGPTILSDDWPTDEMASRGSTTNLLVALPVAFFSGLGVAVSLLDEQTSSLVGVAISASLLPPAVNSGILWVAFLFYEADILTTPAAAQVHNGSTRLLEGDAIKSEFRKMGARSLELTIANIFLVWFSSMLMFRIKERLPIKKKVCLAFILFVNAKEGLHAANKLGFPTGFLE